MIESLSNESAPACIRGQIALVHIDDDVFLPQARQCFGGGLPGSSILDRLHFSVLLLRQQLGLHFGGQGQVLSADGASIAFGQVDLAGVAEDVLTGQLGRVRDGLK